MRFAVALITLVVALGLATIAAWFSIIGLVSIFAGSAFAITLMAGFMEAGKVALTVWLKTEWDIAPKILKAPIFALVVTLMLITSVGTYGYLSKAHLEVTSQATPAILQIEQIDQQIALEQSKIDDANTVKNQLDETVSKLIEHARVSNRGGAREVRQSQQEERTALSQTITEAQTKISELQLKKLELTTTVKEIELEVGPLKYLAQTLGGDNSAESLEKAVRWLIVILVLVFDPAAVIMLIAANHTLLNISKEKKQKKLEITESVDSEILLNETKQTNSENLDDAESIVLNTDNTPGIGLHGRNISR